MRLIVSSDKNTYNLTEQIIEPKIICMPSERIGRILLFMPFFRLLKLLMSGFPNNPPGLGPDACFSIGLMTTAGFLTIVYASIHRFREGLRKG